MPGSASRAVVRVERGLRHEDDDRLAEEVPVAMHFDGAPFAVMMASPADLEDFARGFALTEGKVASMIEIADIDVREVLEGVVVDVHTWQGRSGEPRPSLATDDAGARTRGELPGRSGCGICGSRELEDVVRHPPPVAAGPTVAPDAIERALEALRARQPVNAVTGAVHAAAWALPDGTLVDVREDVGRHNALDKLIGAMLVGNTHAAAGLVQLFDRGDELPEDPLEVLCSPAVGVVALAGERQICNCHKVSEAQICEVIAAGATTVEAVAQACRATTGCGSCKPDVERLLSLKAKPAATVTPLAAAG